MTTRTRTLTWRAMNLLLALSAACMVLFGCAAARRGGPPARMGTHSPPSRNASTLARLEHGLTATNIGSVIGLAVSIGLLATPASPAAHWLIPIFGSLTGVSLAGALSLPWIALALKIALAALAAVILAWLIWTVVLWIRKRSLRSALSDEAADARAALDDCGWSVPVSTNSTPASPAAVTVTGPSASTQLGAAVPHNPTPPLAR